MKIVTLAGAAAVVAGAVAMGGTASAGSLSAAPATVHAAHAAHAAPMAHAAPAAHVTHPAAQAATAGAWGKAHRVPGLMALNEGHSAGVNQVSCASPGNCAATGDYTDAQDHTQPFVASEKKGTWGLAIQVPGIAALSKGGGGLGWRLLSTR